MVHPQARETVQLLVKDADPDVSIRALRSAAGQRNHDAVAAIAKLLQSQGLSALVAAEAVEALSIIDTPEARAALQQYETADPTTYPHRGDNLVNEFLNRRPR